MTSKPVKVPVPITELHFVGLAKIKTNDNGRQTPTNVSLLYTFENIELDEKLLKCSYVHNVSDNKREF